MPDRGSGCYSLENDHRLRFLVNEEKLLVGQEMADGRWGVSLMAKKAGISMERNFAGWEGRNDLEASGEGHLLCLLTDTETQGTSSIWKG